MITEIPRKWRHECDRCSQKVDSENKETLPHWALVSISTKDREHTFYVCAYCKDRFDDYIAGRRIE